MADETTSDVQPVPNDPVPSSTELYVGEAAVEEERKPERPEREVAETVEPEESTEPVKPAAEKHSTDAIEKAARLGIPADEIDDMSPKELNRLVKEMNRFGQHVWDEAAKRATPTIPKVQDAKDEDELFTKEVEDQMLPEYTAPLKKKFSEMAKAAKAKDQEIAEIKQQLQADRIERVHSRIDDLVSKYGDDTAKQLDRTTAKGSEAFKELMIKMRFVQDEGRAQEKNYTEKEILDQAIRWMGLPGKNQVADEKDIKLKEREKEFREGALGQPTSRKASLNTEERLREILKKKNLPTSREVDNSVAWRE